METSAKWHIDEVRSLRTVREEEVVDPLQAFLQTFSALFGRHLPQLLCQAEERFHKEPGKCIAHVKAFVSLWAVRASVKESVVRIQSGARSVMVEEIGGRGLPFAKLELGDNSA